MIKKITIDQLVPGMFVHQILEQKGALRVTSQGRVTSDDVVKTLRKRGVKTLAIDTDKAFNVEQPSSSATVEKHQNSSSNQPVKSKKISLKKKDVTTKAKRKEKKTN